MSSQQLSVVLSGNALITRPFRESRDPAMSRLIELIRSADVRFTNFEMLIYAYGWASADHAVGFHRSTSPRVAEDLLWAGFNLFANANNHLLDFGTDRLRPHIEAMQQLGMQYAGVGLSLQDARRAAYVQTGAGRAALISCASFAERQPAGESLPDFGGRPGLNPQRYETRYVLDTGRFDQLRDMYEALRFGEAQRHLFEIEMYEPLDDAENELIFSSDPRGGMHFVRGQQPEIRTTAHKRDLERVLNAVHHARRKADLVIASIHAHESNVQPDKPAAFVIEWAHACVDAGADIVIASGLRMMRGIEIYNGKPIFYSLGNLWFEFETVDFHDDALLGLHHDARYWECTLPICTFENRKLTNLTLHPVTLGYGKPRWQRGTPGIANRDDAERILSYVSDLLREYGTEIVTVDGVGEVRLR